MKPWLRSPRATVFSVSGFWGACVSSRRFSRIAYRSGSMSPVEAFGSVCSWLHSQCFKGTLWLHGQSRRPRPAQVYPKCAAASVQRCKTGSCQTLRRGQDLGARTGSMASPSCWMALFAKASFLAFRKLGHAPPMQRMPTLQTAGYSLQRVDRQFTQPCSPCFGCG